MVVYIAVFAMLLYESIVDIRTKSIDIVAAVPVGIMGGFLNIFVYGNNKRYVLGAAVGIALILAAWISRQSIGYGDGIIFTVIGLCLEPERVVWLLWLSMTAAGIYGAVGIITKRRGADSSMPFVPFITGGYMVLSVVWLIGRI